MGPKHFVPLNPKIIVGSLVSGLKKIYGHFSHLFTETFIKCFFFLLFSMPLYCKLPNKQVLFQFFSNRVEVKKLWGRKVEKVEKLKMKLKMKFQKIVKNIKKQISTSLTQNSVTTFSLSKRKHSLLWFESGI